MPWHLPVPEALSHAMPRAVDHRSRVPGCGRLVGRAGGATQRTGGATQRPGGATQRLGWRACCGRTRWSRCGRRRRVSWRRCRRVRSCSGPRTGWRTPCSTWSAAGTAHRCCCWSVAATTAATRSTPAPSWPGGAPGWRRCCSRQGRHMPQGWRPSPRPAAAWWRSRTPGIRTSWSTGSSASAEDPGCATRPSRRSRGSTGCRSSLSTCRPASTPTPASSTARTSGPR